MMNKTVIGPAIRPHTRLRMLSVTARSSPSDGQFILHSVKVETSGQIQSRLTTD